MRKEVLIAIFAGVALGLILAFGVWRANVALRSKEKVQEEPKEETTQEASFGLTIASPQDSDLLIGSPVAVSGMTKPLSWVALSGENNDIVVQAQNDGSFKADIPLIEGVNEIKVTAFDTDGTSANKNLSLVYSTEFAKQVNLLSPSPSVTSEPNTATQEVREKVQEKVDSARNAPKFYMGTITDKLEASLEIKDLNSEIKQVSIDLENVTFVKITKTKQEVKFSDVAIGDFIVAMGFRNGNGVLEAIRILITNEFKESQREILLGTASNVKKSEFIFASQKGSDSFAIKDSKDLSIISINNEGEKEAAFLDLVDEEKVIIFGTKESGGFSTRTLYLVQE